MNPNTKKRLLSIGKASCTVTFLALLLYSVDMRQVTHTLISADTSLYFVSFLLFVFNFLLQSTRWGLMLKGMGFNVHPAILYKLYIQGHFINKVLPSTIGGDFAKVYWLQKQSGGGSSTKIIVATIAERTLGLLATLLVIAVATIFYPNLGLHTKYLLIVSSLTPLVVFMYFVFSKNERLSALIQRTCLSKRMCKFLMKLEDIKNVYSKQTQLLVAGFGLSITSQFLGVVLQYIIFKSVNVNVPFYALAVTIPVSRLIAALPISISGMGLKEISLVVMLNDLGVSKADIVSYSVLTRSLVLPLLLIAVIYSGIVRLSNSERKT